MSASASTLASNFARRDVVTVLSVLLLSVLVFLPSLTNPSFPFWDEYYYLPAVQRHVEGTATYAAHPPLGLMLLAAGPQIVGDNKGVPAHSLAALNKITDHDVPEGYSFFGIRLPSAIAAVIGGVLFCAILLRLGLGGYAAFAFSSLYVFENAFVIQFRAVHLDSFQIAFVLAALLVWLRKREEALSWRDYALYSAMIGLAVCVKVNAAVLLAVPGIALLRDVWVQRASRAVLIRSTIRSGAVAGAFLAAILAVFTANFALSPHAPDPRTEAGQHDLERMGPAYQAYLSGRSGFTFAAWEQSITGYMVRMRNDFSGVAREDPNGQAPLTWPFYTKSISYRWDSDGVYTYYSTMVGNPVGWRLSVVGILGGLILIGLRRGRKTGPFAEPQLAGDLTKLETIVAMYAVFLAAHTYMGALRVMYIYHHFIGLILGFVALALCFRIVLAAFPAVQKRENAILGSLSLVVALGFWFYAPFSYHRPLTRADCELRNIAVEQFRCVGH